MSGISRDNLEELLRSSGLSLLGITSADALIEEARHLARWQAEGRAGDMGFMLRDPELLSDPKKLLPQALSVLIVAVRYETTARPALTPNYGRVARYAWGLDYHEILRERLRHFATALTDRFGAIPLRIFSDSVPLMERGLAKRAGLGFIGKNTMLIRPKTGSLFFLAEIILGTEILGDSDSAVDAGCGSCKQCQTHCPTGALDVPYTLDARRCISYLTIEKRGALELWEREAIGEWVFGCDICQECCPFNHTTLKNAYEPELVQLSRKSGVGPQLALREVLSLRTNSQFEARFKGTPLLRTRRVGLLRNSAVVAANTGSVECAGVLEECALHDKSAIVRQHCGWALSVLVRKFSAQTKPWLDGFMNKFQSDPDEVVRGEAQRLLEN